MGERTAIAPRWTVRFPSATEAKYAAAILERFGIGTVVIGKLRARGDWVEVTIVELPAEWAHTALVVERRPRTTHPERTELREEDLGQSTWWDRDE